MQIIHGRSFAVAVPLILTLAVGCERANAAAPAQDWPTAPPGIPRVWHVRLRYHRHAALPPQMNGAKDTLVFVSADQPVLCWMYNGHPQCDLNGDATSSGHAYATGQSHTPVDAGSVDEHYDKSANWRTPPASAEFRVTVGPPQPSKFGPGITSSIGVDAMLRGIAKTVVTGGPQGPASADGAALVQPDRTYPDTQGRDRLLLGVNPEPNPGLPWQPDAGDGPGVARRLMNLPNGEWMLASENGSLYGAATDFDAGGHLVQSYIRQLQYRDTQGGDGGLGIIDVNFCGWLTTATDTWAPNKLPPADRPANPAP